MLFFNALASNKVIIYSIEASPLVEILLNVHCNSSVGVSLLLVVSVPTVVLDQGQKAALLQK